MLKSLFRKNTISNNGFFWIGFCWLNIHSAWTFGQLIVSSPQIHQTNPKSPDAERTVISYNGAISAAAQEWSVALALLEDRVEAESGGKRIILNGVLINIC